MTPTPRLRFVERDTGLSELYEMYGDSPCYRPKTIRVLQQWWENRIHKGNNWFVEGGEWRDVPLENE